MSHITLLQPADEKTDLCQLSLLDKARYAKHDRCMDIEAMKRSYHAMELLCGSSPNHNLIQDTHFGKIGMTCDKNSRKPGTELSQRIV